MTTLHLPRGEHRTHLIALGILMVLAVLIFGASVGDQIWVKADSGDYPMHAMFTQAFVERGSIGFLGIESTVKLPQFLFHLLTLAGTRIAGLSYQEAALYVGVMASAAQALIVFALIRAALPAPFTRKKAALAVGLTLVTLLAGPLSLPTLNDKALYFGYIHPTPYHNPTYTLLKPLALLLFLYALRCVDPDHPPTRSTYAGAIVVTVLAGLAKPSYTICLLPGLAVFSALRLVLRRRVHWGLLIGGLVIPAAIVLYGQSVFTFGDNSGMEYHPFYFFELQHITGLPLRFMLSILFPALVFVLYIRRAIQDRPLVLAWIVNGFGLAAVYLFATENYPAAGNLLWSGFITLFIVYVASVLFLVRQYTGEDRLRLDWRLLLVSLVLGLHFISGLVWYYYESWTPLQYW